MRAPVVIVEFLNPQHLYHPVLECLLRVALGGPIALMEFLNPQQTQVHVHQRLLRVVSRVPAMDWPHKMTS